MPVRQDDSTISDEETLWRRVLDDNNWWTREPDGRIRTSSTVFKDRQSYELSMYIAASTSESEVLSSHPRHGIVQITAGQVRAAGPFSIARDEIPIEEDPAGHAHIVVSPSPVGKVAQKMAQSAKWARLPADTPPNTGLNGYPAADEAAAEHG